MKVHTFMDFVEIFLNTSSQKIWIIKGSSVMKIEHSSKASILQSSAFFIVQLSHPYMTTGKTITSTRQTSVGKVMLLLFNMLSRLVRVLLPRSKCLNFMAAVTICTLEPPQNKYLTVSIVSPSICHEVRGLDAMILVFWMLNFKPAFHSPLSLSWRGSLAPLRFLL